jgi:hypothetical protein
VILFFLIFEQNKKYGWHFDSVYDWGNTSVNLFSFSAGSLQKAEKIHLTGGQANFIKDVFEGWKNIKK